MDKVEYKLRLEEIEKLMENEKYPDAARLADTIDWRRVKGIPLLIRIANLYKMSKRYEDCRNILLIAYDKNPTNKHIIYNLCEVYLDYGDIVNAIECFKEYAKVAGKDDVGVYTLRYRMYEAQNVGIEEKIELLENLKKKERIEEWEYELAYLYHRAGFATKCVEECDEIILWFGEGPYVIKAMELKMLHEPLSPSQQEKYNRRNEAKFAAAKAGSMSPYEDELDFRVKTMDIGNKFNTINLQAELAENVREYLEDTGEIKPVKPEFERDRVYHETIPADAKEIFFEDKTSDIIQGMNNQTIPETQSASAYTYNTSQSEVYSGGYAASGVGAATGGYAASGVGAATGGYAASGVGAVTGGYAASQTGAAASSVQSPDPFGQTQVFYKKNDNLDSFLSQKSDGQILLSVPEQPAGVEKQITGQMNINDVLNNWENIKQQNREKMQENIRKNVLAQTGEIFSRFDESTNEDLLSAFEKTEAPATDSEECLEDKILNAKEIPEEAYLEEDLIKADTEEQSEEDYSAKDATGGEESVQVVLETEAASENFEAQSLTEAAPENFEAQSLAEAAPENFEAQSPTKAPDNFETQRLEEEVEKALAEENRKETFSVNVADSSTQNLEEVSDNTADIPVTMAETATEEEESRFKVTKEMKSLFGPFFYSKKMKKQILHAAESLSLAAYTSNLVISSDNEESGNNLATAFVKYLKQTDGNFSGKVAKISAFDLNKKDVPATLSKVANGAMIIEHANSLTSEAITRILQTLNQEETGYLILLVDRKNEVRKLMARSPYMKEFFNLPVDVIAMSTKMLVEFGEKYAFEKGYALETFACLAMNKRIDDMQIGMHVVTIGEIKNLVDDAIAHAEKKKFGRSLSRKRTNSEGMVLLLEQDFEGK